MGTLCGIGIKHIDSLLALCTHMHVHSMELSVCTLQFNDALVGVARVHYVVESETRRKCRVELLNYTENDENY